MTSQAPRSTVTDVVAVVAFAGGLWIIARDVATLVGAIRAAIKR